MELHGNSGTYFMNDVVEKKGVSQDPFQRQRDHIGIVQVCTAFP